MQVVIVRTPFSNLRLSKFPKVSWPAKGAMVILAPIRQDTETFRFDVLPYGGYSHVAVTVPLVYGSPGNRVRGHHSYHNNILYIVIPHDPADSANCRCASAVFAPVAGWKSTSSTSCRR